MAEEQTRGKQTMIILAAIVVAAIAIVAAIFIVQARSDYNEIYPGCWTIYNDGPSCEMRVNPQAYLSGR